MENSTSNMTGRSSTVQQKRSHGGPGDLNWKVENLRQKSSICILAIFSPLRHGLSPCSTALFLKNFHRAGPVLQEFGFVLRAGVWHSTSVVQALPGVKGSEKCKVLVFL